MIIPIVVFFGSILFGFLLLYLAIRFWRKKRNSVNRQPRHFSQNYASSYIDLNDHDDENSEIEDYADLSSPVFNAESGHEAISISAGITEITQISKETTPESSWDYNNSESSASYSDSLSYSDSDSSSDSSSPSDSSSSCSSGSSCSSSSSSD